MLKCVLLQHYYCIIFNFHYDRDDIVKSYLSQYTYYNPTLKKQVWHHEVQWQIGYQMVLHIHYNIVIVFYIAPFMILWESVKHIKGNYSYNNQWNFKHIIASTWWWYHHPLKYLKRTLTMTFVLKAENHDKNSLLPRKKKY